jgi:acyl-CoA hydrolase
VAINDGKPAPVPVIEPATELEHRRWLSADARREQRRALRQALRQPHNKPLRDLSLYDSRLGQLPAYITSQGVPSRLSPGDTYTRTFEWVFGQHVNPAGTCFGGYIMDWMHRCAMIAATRHTRQNLLLASIDQLNFANPIPNGHGITIRAVVCQTFHSSLEVYLTVESHHANRYEQTLSNESFMTFVAVDALGERVKIPELRPETEEERYFARTAHERRATRLAERESLDTEYE